MQALIDRFVSETQAVVPLPNPNYKEGLDPFPNGPAIRSE